MRLWQLWKPHRDYFFFFIYYVLTHSVFILYVAVNTSRLNLLQAHRVSLEIWLRAYKYSHSSRVCVLVRSPAIGGDALLALSATWQHSLINRVIK